MPVSVERSAVSETSSTVARIGDSADMLNGDARTLHDAVEAFHEHVRAL
jgi:hypothetical protein